MDGVIWPLSASHVPVMLAGPTKPTSLDLIPCTDPVRKSHTVWRRVFMAHVHTILTDASVVRLTWAPSATRLDVQSAVHQRRVIALILPIFTAVLLGITIAAC